MARFKSSTVVVLLAIAALACGGWASPAERTQHTIAAGFDAMKGEPIQVVFDVLGLPNEERPLAGRKMYVWNITACEVQVLADNAGKVDRGQITGGVRGCRWVYQAMVGYLQAKGLPYK